MIAAHIMTTGVITLQKEMTVKEGIKILTENRIRQSPVIDEHKKIVGVFRAKKLVQLILPKYITDGLLKDVRFAPDLPQLYEKARELGGKNIYDVMSDDFIKVLPDATVFEVATIFVNAEKPQECIYVVDNQEMVIGIITPWDIFKKIWGVD
ncbi:MAG: CBS domain-containing protein [Deltaproteobacteria bacterium]|nr:CBS domain-containing protein [Deltaproteobacteria bacterium]